MATIEEFQAGMQQCMESFAQAAIQVVEGVLPIIQQMYDVLHNKYLEAGAPYGDTQEGLLRWMDEIAEIRRMEQRIEYISSHHQSLALLRKRIAERTAATGEEKGVRDG